MKILYTRNFIISKELHFVSFPAFKSFSEQYILPGTLTRSSSSIVTLSCTFKHSDSYMMTVIIRWQILPACIDTKMNLALKQVMKSMIQCYEFQIPSPGFLSNPDRRISGTACEWHFFPRLGLKVLTRVFERNLMLLINACPIFDFKSRQWRCIINCYAD